MFIVFWVYAERVKTDSAVGTTQHIVSVYLCYRRIVSQTHTHTHTHTHTYSHVKEGRCIVVGGKSVGRLPFAGSNKYLPTCIGIAAVGIHEPRSNNHFCTK